MEFTDFPTSPPRAPLLESDYWAHFLRELPRFTLDAGIQSLTFLPEGGSIERGHDGLLVSSGPLRLGPGSRSRGLILQLDAGTIVLERGSSLEGGLWLIETGLHDLQPLHLVLEADARIAYDREAALRALWMLPPTQLGWRILSPGLE